MLTQDDDYLALASSGLRHAGILYCHPLKYLRQPGRFASAVAELALLEPAVITGTARFV